MDAKLRADLEQIAGSILVLRNRRVMLDRELALLYGVTTKRLNEQVRRNAARFPPDFSFQLTAEEDDRLRSQFATSKGRGGRRYAPRAFTEHGALMAATVLNSSRAVEVSIHVVRAFVELRKLAFGNRELEAKLQDLERKVEALAGKHDHLALETRESIRELFAVIREMMKPVANAPRPIGFVRPVEKG